MRLSGLLVCGFSILLGGLSLAEEGAFAGKDFDLQGWIDGELAEGKHRVVVPPGRYRVTPKGRMHLRLKNLADVEIIADGVELICTETTRAVTIEGCRNLTLRGLTIDYDPLPFTQGRITAISGDGLVHDIEIFEGYPTGGVIKGRKYEIFRPDTRTLRFGSYHGCEVRRVSPREVQVIKPVRWKGRATEQVGDIIAIDCLHAPNGSIPHALSMSRSSGVRLEEVSIYASAMFGFIESECLNSIYQSCVVDRRPVETDIKRRADARIRSLNADAFHSYHAMKGPSYLGCRAKFQGDDCIAINGEYHLVMGHEGKGLRVIARREFHVAVGDSVELMSYDGVRLPDARVTAVEETEDASADEREFIGRQPMDVGLKNSMKRAFRVTLDRAVDLPMGSLIGASNRLGSGFRIEGGDFGFTRSRGFLIQASDGEITGNRLDGCWGEAIKVEPEYWWLSAGCSSKLQIRDNIILNCRQEGIRIAARGATRTPSPAGAHRKMTITGNRIEGRVAPLIHVSSTDGLILSGNSLNIPMASFPNSNESAKPIEVERCLNVELGENPVRKSD